MKYLSDTVLQKKQEAQDEHRAYVEKQDHAVSKSESNKLKQLVDAIHAHESDLAERQHQFMLLKQNISNYKTQMEELHATIDQNRGFMKDIQAQKLHSEQGPLMQHRVNLETSLVCQTPPTTVPLYSVTAVTIVVPLCVTSN